MTQIESLGPAQLALSTVFHRVAQAPAASLVDIDALMEKTNDMVVQPKSTSAQQSIDLTVDDDVSGRNEPANPKSRLIVAVDFGTTYSTVSYAKIDPGVDSTRLLTSGIRCISSYEHVVGNSDARENSRTDNVPTKLLYLGTGVPQPEESDDDSCLDDESLSDVDVQLIQPNELARRRQRRKRRRNPYVSSPKKRSKTTWSRPAGVDVHWGFTVQHVQKFPRDLARCTEKEVVELIKLTLGDGEDEDKDLQKKRVELMKQIEDLCKRRIVQSRDHLLFDYLFRLLRHAKSKLNEDGLLQETQLEYVLCVPVSWSESACRTMHDVMVKAVQACKLDVLAQNVIPNLFIVSEPEAAAQYVIASLGNDGELTESEVFIILDAGGGTVDITTYKVTSDENGPLRLEGEVVAPDGALCGSSLITDRYMHKTREKLAEVDPDGDPDYLDGVATALANDWDVFDKRGIDLTETKKKKKKKNFNFGGKIYHNNHVIEWTEAEIREIFEPSLKGTMGLLEKQLQRAREKNLNVSKLIVVGGFGESPSLKGRIQQVLSAYRNDYGETIEAIWPRHFPTSAVARGAVLRALDKRDGPSRISRSSFGFLRHEPHKSFPEHEEAKAVAIKDKTDHNKFVYDTIHWLVHAGEKLPSSYQTEPIVSYHTFDSAKVKLVCREELYVSKREHRSHFRYDHEVNKGASLLSSIEIDVSDLRHEFPLVLKAGVGPRTKRSNMFIRVVEFDLVIEIEGKQLKYEARYPPGAETPEKVKARKSGYVSLAPSFAPGTE